MPQITVVGGGIGGLTAALAFAKQGASVCVLEQAPALTEVGAGIQITPNAMRVLVALGLGPAIAAVALPSDAVVPHDALTGRAVARFDLSRQTPRYHFIHRARLIAVLADTCMVQGVEVRTGAAVTASPDKTLNLDAFGAGDVDLTVFADGLHSVGRPLIDGPSEAKFTGQVAWRALVPGRMPAEARIFMAPGKHLVTYPLPGDLINVVAVRERDTWAAEGWSHPDDPDNLRAAFADCHRSINDLLADVEAVNLWGLYRHPIADRWVRDRFAMLGDAAHPTLPFLAQGANLAIEDAWVLAECWAQGTLATYTGIRRPRVARAIAAANANAVNYHLGGLRRSLAFTALRGISTIAPNAFLSRLSWLYDHDVTRPASSLRPRT